MRSKAKQFGLLEVEKPPPSERSRGKSLPDRPCASAERESRPNRCADARPLSSILLARRRRNPTHRTIVRSASGAPGVGGDRFSAELRPPQPPLLRAVQAESAR